MKLFDIETSASRGGTHENYGSGSQELILDFVNENGTVAIRMHALPKGDKRAELDAALLHLSQKPRVRITIESLD